MNVDTYDGGRFLLATSLRPDGRVTVLVEKS